jgi:hypothetical protein
MDFRRAISVDDHRGCSLALHEAGAGSLAFYCVVGLCFLWLSPIRYMLFQLVAACSCPVQSWVAFGTMFYPGIFIAVPIAFSILYALGFLVPLFVMLLITGFERPPR